MGWLCVFPHMLFIFQTRNILSTFHNSMFSNCKKTNRKTQTNQIWKLPNYPPARPPRLPAPPTRSTRRSRPHGNNHPGYVRLASRTCVFQWEPPPGACETILSCMPGAAPPSVRDFLPNSIKSRALAETINTTLKKYIHKSTQKLEESRDSFRKYG